jgi:hypothetical protein
MTSAKDIRVAPVSRAAADACVLKHHYSGKIVNNSQLHFGVFIGDVMHGAMQFGPSIDKRKIQPLVDGTSWHGFIELNRMAFGPELPRNSESRAMAVAFRMMRRQYPHIEWVVSFSDATQCGDGAIYRATGFTLTGIKKNTTMLLMPDGSVVSNKTLDNPNHLAPDGMRGSTAAKRNGAKALEGYQLRYIYFLNPAARERLTVPVIPFSRIDEMGASMYKGIPRPKQATGGTTTERQCNADPDASP